MQYTQCYLVMAGILCVQQDSFATSSLWSHPYSTRTLIRGLHRLQVWRPFTQYRKQEMDYFRVTPWYHWTWVLVLVGTLTVSVSVAFSQTTYWLLLWIGWSVFPWSNSLWPAWPTGEVSVLHELLSADSPKTDSFLYSCRSCGWRSICIHPD